MLNCRRNGSLRCLNQEQFENMGSRQFSLIVKASRACYCCPHHKKAEGSLSSSLDWHHWYQVWLRLEVRLCSGNRVRMLMGRSSRVMGQAKRSTYRSLMDPGGNSWLLHRWLCSTDRQCSQFLTLYLFPIRQCWDLYPGLWTHQANTLPPNQHDFLLLCNNR